MGYPVVCCIWSGGGTYCMDISSSHQCCRKVPLAVNKENIQKWVDALRSGEYEQGKGGLRKKKDNTFCCLGVACDISGVGDWKTDNVWYLEYYVDEDCGGSSSADLPDQVSDWLGIPSGSPELKTQVGEMTDAITLNDDSGYTFSQIADAVERTYLNED